MPAKKLLEEYPLYRRLKFDCPPTLNGMEKVAINMFCDECGSNQTFQMINEYWSGRNAVNYPTAGSIVQMRYRCTHCSHFEREFFVKISDDWESIMKVGQFPAWDIKGNNDIEKLLGEHSSYFKRGLICESQGYGIGAFAYYRRIVEEIIDSLLDQISNLLSGEEKQKYADALAKTKTTRVTAEKIELVKDLLPPILRPNNMNPLSTLHEVLSEGLHADADERCVQLAEAVRNVLVFLTNQIEVSTAAGKSFTESMKGLLDKKSVQRKEK